MQANSPYIIVSLGITHTIFLYQYAWKLYLECRANSPLHYPRLLPQYQITLELTYLPRRTVAITLAEHVHVKLSK